MEHNPNTSIKNRCNECKYYMPINERCLYFGELDWNCGNFERKKRQVILSGGKNYNG